MGFKLKKKLKKLRKRIKRLVKEVAIPVASTVASGGTLSAVGYAVAGSAVSKEATRKIKDPVWKAAVGAAITGGFSGSTNLAKDAAESVVVTHVAKQTKSAAVGAVVGATVCGEYKDSTDVVKGATKEVARENVTKVVAKKTKNQILAQGAGHLVGIGTDKIFESLEKKDSAQVIQCSKQEGETFEDSLPDESVSGNLDDAPFPLPPRGESEDSPYTSFPEERTIDASLDNAGDRLLSKINNGHNSSGMISNVTLMSSADSKEPNFRHEISFKYGNNTTVITQDLKHTKISIINKLTDNYSVGSAGRTSNDLGDVRYGCLFKSGNQTQEVGVGFDRKGIWDSEFYVYKTLKTGVKTDANVVGACVSKETLKQNINAPLCGNVGTVTQQTLVCSDSITVTDKISLNTNGGLCAASMMIAARWAAGGAPALAAATLVIEEVAPAIL